MSESGGREDDPDFYILDKNRTPGKRRRCEFKFFHDECIRVSSAIKEFEHNTDFDIAVVWRLPTN